MLAWLSENRPLVLVILGFAGLLALGVFVTTRRVVHLSGLAVVGLLALAVILVHQFVETERQQVKRKTEELAAVVNRGDLAGLEKLLAQNFFAQGMNRDALLIRAGRVLKPERQRSVGVGQIKVTGENGATQLGTACNVSASGEFGQSSLEGTFLGVLELDWTREADGQYRLRSFRVLNSGGHELAVPQG